MNSLFPGLDPYLPSFWSRSVLRRLVGYGEWELDPLPLRRKPPVFRVPLRIGEDDAPLDLQAVRERKGAA